MDALNLGCGAVPLANAINHDRYRHSPHVDVTHDLNRFPWPWRDDSMDEIQAIDVVEHLENWVGFFDECWRILRPGGRVTVRVPRYDSPNVYMDPTHKRGYHIENFDFLDPDTEWGRKAVVYTPRGWRLIQAVDDKTNITALLEVRK